MLCDHERSVRNEKKKRKRGTAFQLCTLRRSPQRRSTNALDMSNYGSFFSVSVVFFYNCVHLADDDLICIDFSRRSGGIDLWSAERVDALIPL